jgi:hypothetical protein
MSECVVVVVEELDAHRAERRFRKVLPRLVDEPLAAIVLVVVLLAGHVHHQQVRTAVAVQIGERRLAAPADRLQSDLCGDVGERVVSRVAIEHRLLVAIGMEMSLERVGQTGELAVRSLAVAGVLADVADEEIEQAVAVVVHEHGA